MCTYEFQHVIYLIRKKTLMKIYNDEHTVLFSSDNGENFSDYTISNK